VIASQPAPDEGLDCDRSSPTCGVPVETVLRLRFNRHLLPATAVRQSVRVYAGSPENTLFLAPSYDVIERVLSFALPSGQLLPGMVYTVELVKPIRAGDFGFRAYDGAPIAAATQPLVWSFRTRSQGGVGSPADLALPADCQAALSSLTASCGQANCHAVCPDDHCEHQPRMGLVLDSPQGIDETAIWQVAHQTLTGQDETTPLRNPRRFGAQMPIIEPGRPENSYLVYKLLVSPDNYRDASGFSCESRYFGRLPDRQCLAPSEAERQRLRDWFVRLGPMPPDSAPFDAVSPISALRGLADWIGDGATTSGCSGI